MSVSLVAIVAGILGVVAVALYFRKAHRVKVERFAQRPEVSLHKIYEFHFADSGVPEERFGKLWKELAIILEVPAGKLLPTDRFTVELSPPKGFEFDDQINDVKYVINKYCQRAGIEPERIQSIRDYIIAFGSREV